MKVVYQGNANTGEVVNRPEAMAETSGVTFLGMGYQCPSCEEWFVATRPDAETLIEVDNNVEDNLYREWEEIEVWWCPDGCLIQVDDDAVPQLVEVWECDSCEARSGNILAAARCCT